MNNPEYITNPQWLSAINFYMYADFTAIGIFIALIALVYIGTDIVVSPSVVKRIFMSLLLFSLFALGIIWFATIFIEFWLAFTVHTLCSIAIAFTLATMGPIIFCIMLKKFPKFRAWADEVRNEPMNEEINATSEK